MYRLIVTTLSIGLVSGFAAGPAHAANSSVDPPPANHTSTKNNNGNGDHNRNAIGIKSPTSNRGYQHTNNGNAGGLNSTLNTLCRQATNCKMTQNLIIFNVERSKDPRNTTDDPAKVTAHAPPPNAATAPPFLYIAGPDGTIVMR